MADELVRKLNGASEHLDPGFDAARIEAGVSGLSRRIVRDQRRRRAGFALTSVALVLLGVWIAREPALLAALKREPAALQTHDGSVATRLSPETELQLVRDAQDDVALTLVRGKGHFKVTPNPRRSYRVRSGDVEVQVLGTAFEVERVGPRTRVRVEHGLVRVRWPGGESLLHKGEQGLFPRAPQPNAAALAAPPMAPAVTALAPSAPSAPNEPEVPALEDEAALESATELSKPERAQLRGKHARERWRVLARAGKHQEAFGSLGQAAVDDLAGLLLAADAARLSGHPSEAAGHLTRLIERYPRSNSAHLAAFTLGRLALYELKQPALAARSFAQAYTLNARGPLAEDALAREAEAYHRAGDAERAKSAAERYLQRYPSGARKAEVARILGPAR